MIFLETLDLAIGLNVLGFLIAYSRRSDKLTDFSYGLTFFVIGLVAFFSSDATTPSRLLFGLITFWSLRIACFLLVRILKTKKDKRFDNVRENFWKFGGFWLGQAITAWIILLPSIYILNQPPTSLEVLAMSGMYIALAGLMIETIADYQKFTFKQNPKNKDKFIQSGLWKYSRHPNYFGEILVWLGVYLFTYSYLNFGQRLLFAISPLFITYLLIFVTGLPKLEKYADQKWGHDKAYQKYKSQTNVLMILPPKT